MRGLVIYLSRCLAYRGRNAESLELLLDSYVFTELLSSMERKWALNRLQGYITLPFHGDLVRVSVAHGVKVDSFPKHSTRHTSLDPFRVFDDRDVLLFEEMWRSGVVSIPFTNFGNRIWFEDVETARALMDCGLDLDCGPDEWSPLHQAVAGRSSIEVVELLITRGMLDVNAPGHYYYSIRNERLTPLHARLQMDLGHHHKELSVDKLNLLFSYGADPYIKSAKGISPYDMLMGHELGRAYVSANEHWFPNRPRNEDQVVNETLNS